MSNDDAKGSLTGNLVSLASMGVGFVVLVMAWRLGERAAEWQNIQWQLVFLGLALTMAGQWIVNPSSALRKHQIAVSCAVLALVGLWLQWEYELFWVQSTPFVMGYIFFALAAEIFIRGNSSAETTARTFQALRFAAVIWNVAWVAYYVGTPNMQLPDLVNLYIAFSGIWTFATAVVAWSEYGVALEESAPSDGVRVFRSLDVRALRIFGDLRKGHMKRVTPHPL
jgi:hypothetical protein